jgi:hypothetical protein
MLTTQELLSQIALACGLADQSHLSKFFRSEPGESPGAWCRRNLSDAQAEVRNSRLRASRWGTVAQARLYQIIRQSGEIADRSFEIEFFDAGVAVAGLGGEVRGRI